ncbi:hypothetical protein IWX84_002567 [Flavobacterium sp. CG_9.10]|uniref:restriction system modified-DNA reader domain-containing protein n=1 Tax=Flavobacterium sp. CG_9.10 TaxID=2787729 RepID=UPI0018C8E4D0|nr:hypothetical protein [Flavobacterium sp. CG_9.10]MBG6111680.1 hypothetical protein [Flavobacterium sp. CG_9.10]
MNYKEIPDITLKMILDIGILRIGTRVYAYTDNKITGTLDKEGAITLDLENETKIFPFPSGAARAITKTSVNGWKFWRVLENGHYNELSYYKEKYKLNKNQT